jgi:hypothetical protein
MPALGFSTYLAQMTVNSTLRGQAFTVPPTLYLACFSSDPTGDNITVNELSGPWYARQVTGAWAAPVGSGNTTSNSSQIQFPAVTGSAVTVTHVGIYDASGSGNLLYHGALTTPKTFNVGDVAVFAAGSLAITMGAA